MVSSLLEIIGDLVESEMTSSDAIPIFYNLLFFPINAYYVLRWLLNQEALQLSEDEEVLFLQCFAPLGFSRGQFSRLLARAQFEAVPLDDGRLEPPDGCLNASGCGATCGRFGFLGAPPPPKRRQ